MRSRFLALGAALVIGAAACSGAKPSGSKSSTTTTPIVTAPTSTPPTRGSSATTLAPKAVPAGGIVAAMTDGSIALVDSSFRVQRTLVRPSSRGVSTKIEVTSDGTRVFAQFGNGLPENCFEVVEIDLRSGAERSLGQYSAWSVTRDGSRLVANFRGPARAAQCVRGNSFESHWLVRDLTRGTQWVDPKDNFQPSSVVWSPDERQVAFGYAVAHQLVEIYDVASSGTLTKHSSWHGALPDLVVSTWTGDGIYTFETVHQGPVSPGRVYERAFARDPRSGIARRILYTLVEPIPIARRTVEVDLVGGNTYEIVKTYENGVSEEAGRFRLVQLTGTRHDDPAGIVTNVTALAVS
jgi:hypothetical protein